MIYLYPTNKMENLLVLLDKIQQTSPLPVFSKDLVIVQNAGMQHWLNLSLANSRGISLNIDYALPSQFLWKLIRTLASDDDVPDQSPYSREVLTWRIHHLLGLKKVTDDQDFSSVTRYWQGNVQAESADDKASLKRYQLACQLADLYEQYLIFRPEWINDWHHECFTQQNSSNDIAEQMLWQGKLWYLLSEEQSYNPIELVQQAINNLDDKKQLLPPRIHFFGINAMAPMWLSFIRELSEYIDVHFFHLNPCINYWGDIITEKQAVKMLNKWVDGHDDISQVVGNPLLANLGQQGREFLALLQDVSAFNINAFEDVIEDDSATNSSAQPSSVLTHIQQDILSLSDRRTAPVALKDDSILITSCHSALREVQAVHDWLLHQFNQDKSLTPKDVLVMCPQVEQYAPYINAVFTRGWQDVDDKIPPLPCSIADRVSKDSEPLVAAFSELLMLPDSRFQLSQLIGFLRLPSMQQQFGLSIEEIDKISIWLEQASIHWGLDAQHKAKVLALDSASDSFSWAQGLSRLLRGFAYADEASIYQQQLVLPTVEGNDAILLGKLMLIVEQLQQQSQLMTQARSASGWQVMLTELIESLFFTEDDNGFIIIYQAIEALVEYCQHANFTADIELVIVQDFLNNHFSQPDPGRQFMVGQVTFCSMLPMRSIPFKVIAILGLNDGEFPRQRQPLAFDLMAITPAQLGDRSRRGDDRYLFLEAIISARQFLYLSFQGRNIKNNNDKQASLVLKELMEYLTLGFGWSFEEQADNAIEQKSDLRQLAMQPFSFNNYQGAFPSFDQKWLSLVNEEEVINTASLSPLSIEPLSAQLIAELSLDAKQLISFYQHPAKYFAQQQLSLYLEDRAITLEDAEPFVVDSLQSYLFREQMLSAYLQTRPTQQADSSPLIDDINQSALLSGKFPDLPTTIDTLNKWQEDSESFSEYITERSGNETKTIHITLSVPVNISNDVEDQSSTVSLSTRVNITDDKVIFYRSSSAKSKDYFTLYLHQLMLQAWQQSNNVSETNNSENSDKNSALQITDEQQCLLTVNACYGFYFDTKSQKITQYRYQQLDNATEKLTALVDVYFLGQQQALLLNSDIGEKFFKSKSFEQHHFEQLWSDPNNVRSLGQDPYISYFWPNCPEFNGIKDQLFTLYQHYYQAREQVKS